MILRPNNTALPTLPADATGWMFEVVLDYGKHTVRNAPMDALTPWPLRGDAFSTHRSGFELRTRRLCQRMMMFHRVDAANDPVLVAATVFVYEPDPVATRLTRVVRQRVRAHSEHSGDSWNFGDVGRPAPDAACELRVHPVHTRDHGYPENTHARQRQRPPDGH
jgi:hypothetical protein